MRASLLTIGDELLIGQVLNSNVQWISEKLTETGLSVTQHLSVGDAVAAIHEALDYLVSRSDVIIIGGGLGPTHDDVTMEALSQHFAIPLVYDEAWIAQIERFFKARNRVMSENNKKQGYLLQTATRINNDCGTAAGQYFKVPHLHDAKKMVEIFVVPGVPHEMKSMLERFVLPILSKLTTGSGEKILKETLLTTGMGESALALKCDSFVQKIKTLPNVNLAFLPNAMQVRLRLQMFSKTPEDEIQFHSLLQELIQCCGEDFFGLEPLTLESLIVKTLNDQHKSLSLAESCTGGLISHLLTQVPGASDVLRGTLVAYQTTLKETELNVLPELILKNGVVSEAVAKAMAEGIRKKWNTSFGISTTGYLGPSGGDSHAKIGTVWIAIATPKETFARCFIYENNRERSKERAAISALDLLRRTILGA